MMIQNPQKDFRSPSKSSCYSLACGQQINVNICT